MANKVAFLDRDGTINIDYGYVTTPSKISLIDRAAQAIVELRQNDFKVVIVTNQSAISRGMASIEDVNLTNQELLKQLGQEDSNAIIDQILLSPGKPGDKDDTRKPEIGMLRELNFEYDKQSSCMVGDKLSDVEFGINAGLKKENCILLAEENKDSEDSYEHCAKDLFSAVNIVLSR